MALPEVPILVQAGKRARRSLAMLATVASRPFLKLARLLLVRLEYESQTGRRAIGGYPALWLHHGDGQVLRMSPPNHEAFVAITTFPHEGRSTQALAIHA